MGGDGNYNSPMDDVVRLVAVIAIGGGLLGFLLAVAAIGLWVTK